MEVLFQIKVGEGGGESILKLLVQKLKVESEPRKKCFSKHKGEAHGSVCIPLKKENLKKPHNVSFLF